MKQIKLAIVMGVLLISLLCNNGYSLTVPRWSVYEITLHTTQQYNNPFLDVKVTAIFTGPGNIQKTVTGFWDEGATFLIRFTPTLPGAWRYQTFSSDNDLNNHTGKFTCTAAEPDVHGFVRVDKNHPYHFIYDDKTHYFLFGTTYYHIIANAQGGGGWEKAIDSIHKTGINKIRFRTGYIQGNKHGARYPNSSPYGSSHDQLNMVHFHVMDTIIQYLLQKGITADLILFSSGSNNFGTWQQDERYVTYVVNRYSAYPNVIWCLSNEWNYTGKDKAYWNSIGEIIRDKDPWMNNQGSLRLLSTHQQTRIDFQFFDTSWPSFACIQYGVRNKGYKKEDNNEWKPSGGTLYHEGDEWGNAGIVFNLGHNMPVVNDEYGYAGEPDDASVGHNIPFTRKKHRQVMWGIYTAGGYGSTGDKYEYQRPHGQPYYSADWHYISEYADIKHLIDFFTQKGIPYWEMSSKNELVKSGKRIYVLANPGREYVIYTADGGAFSLAPEQGKYAVLLFDPRTGKEQLLQEINGLNETSFNTPVGKDWVIYLKRK